MGYIPTRDTDLDTWALNWTTLVTAAPTTYGLTSTIATAMAALYTAWHTAFLAATNPATRTPVTVAAKDSAKGNMVPQLRLYSQQVKANAAVSDGNKTALGIHLDDPDPTPIPIPSTNPVLSLRAIDNLSMTLRFADSATPDSRTKPPGATQCLIFSTIATGASTDPDAAQFEGAWGAWSNKLFPVLKTFDAADRGKICTFWAKWANAKGQEGPWGPPFSHAIN
jgi:hypothetical protein